MPTWKWLLAGAGDIASRRVAAADATWAACCNLAQAFGQAQHRRDEIAEQYHA